MNRESNLDRANERIVAERIREYLVKSGELIHKPIITKSDSRCEWDFRFDDWSVLFEIKCRSRRRIESEYAILNLWKLQKLLYHVSQGRKVYFINGWYDLIDFMDFSDFERGVKIEIARFHRKDRPEEIRWIAKIPIGCFKPIGPSPAEFQSPNMTEG